MNGLPTSNWRKILAVAGNVLCGAWLVVAGLFFFFRFSMVFYGENKGAVDAALEHLVGRP